MTAFQFSCLLHGFDLDGFDRWLATLEPCAAKVELTERRARAEEVHKDGGAELLRHLEFMKLRWLWILRDECLTPKARRDEKHNLEQRRKASLPRSGLADVIRKLAQKTDALGEWIPPKELWSELYGAMDENQLSPHETTDKKGNLIILYSDANRNAKTIRFNSFKVAISRYRS